MKVPNSEFATRHKDNENLLKRMNQGLERKIASKEKEIQEIDALYDKKIEQSKEEGERQYLQSLDRNQNRIVQESNTFEEKIQNYKDQLKKTQETVEKEEAILKGNEKIKLEKLKTQLEDNFQDQYQATQENQRDIQSSTQDKIKEIATKSKVEKLTMENNAQHEINALSSEFNRKASDSEKDYRNKLDRDVRAHNAEVSRQKDELKKIMTLDAEKNKRLGDEQNRVNKEQINFKDKHQQEMLRQREADFKVRYEKIVKEHDDILGKLGESFSADVKKMVEQTSVDKKIIQDRINDPFYRIDKLTPKLTEDLKEVTITLPVSDYEKENVHLSTQGRKIKITLSRKYADSMSAEDGSINRSTRSELYSKEFDSKDLLSPTDIKQNYQDGILTFKIKKA